MKQATETLAATPARPVLLERHTVRVSAARVKSAPRRQAPARGKEELCDPAEFTVRWWRAPESEE